MLHKVYRMTKAKTGGEAKISPRKEITQAKEVVLVQLAFMGYVFSEMDNTCFDRNGM